MHASNQLLQRAGFVISPRISAEGNGGQQLEAPEQVVDPEPVPSADWFIASLSLAFASSAPSTSLSPPDRVLPIVAALINSYQCGSAIGDSSPSSLLVLRLGLLAPFIWPRFGILIANGSDTTEATSAPQTEEAHHGDRPSPTPGPDPVLLVAHLVESVLESVETTTGFSEVGSGGYGQELHLLAAAFVRCQFSPSLLVTRWLRQCLLDVLPQAQLVVYTTVLITHGADYQVYTCLALLLHLRPVVLQLAAAVSAGGNVPFALEVLARPVSGFELVAWLPFMHAAARQHGGRCVAAMGQWAERRGKGMAQGSC
jgi:hypothetical protein